MYIYIYICVYVCVCVYVYVCMYICIHQLCQFSSEFHVVRRRFVLEKNIANFNFYDDVFYVPKWQMEV